LRLSRLTICLFLALCSLPRARAEATLLLEEPYSYDGALAGTGHAAVYLSGVCAESPVVLRLCAPGETGVVISRYHRVAGYDWIAIPLIPYLYAVEKQEDVPLFADKKMVAFLRDHYRRDHLEELVPDLPDGGTPEGDWYELVGASYLRTIYAYEIETDPKLDAALIRKLNGQSNHDHFDLVTTNCADFARGVIDFYHSRAVHRSILGDLGVSTPKQMAITLSKYGRHHPEWQSSHYVIPQVPGTLPRSKPVHGVLESVITAKKYMLPLLVWHPYVAGSMVAAYLGRGRFDPAKNALILDANNQFDTPLTRAERKAAQNRFEEIVPPVSPVGITERVVGHIVVEHIKERPIENDPRWSSLQAAAEPALDASGEPVLQVRSGGEITPVGIARTNILSVPESAEFAADVVKARLREELKPGTARKTARGDVESDFALLQRLLEPQSSRLAAVASPAREVPLDPLSLYREPSSDQALSPAGFSVIDRLP
jgi:hypothetical protein